jgi:hypothetical protein
VTFEVYTRHIDWSLTVGRRGHARQRQPCGELEGAQALLEAEEAVDDPLRMTRCLLAGKAVAGIVTAVGREHREVVTTNRAPWRAAGRAVARSFWSDGGQLGGGQHLTPFGRASRLLADLAFCIVSEFRGARFGACAPPFRPVHDALDQAQQRGESTGGTHPTLETETSN